MAHVGALVTLRILHYLPIHHITAEKEFSGQLVTDVQHALEKNLSTEEKTLTVEIFMYLSFGNELQS